MDETVDIDITQYLEGESLTVEYKEDTSGEFSEQKIYECAVAFANTSGGVLLIGVTDSGQLKGATSIGTRWQSPHELVSMISQNTWPSLMATVFFITHNGIKIIFIKIQQAVTIVGTKSGKYLKRRLDGKGKPGNYPMEPSEIASGVSVIGGMDFSSTELSGCDLNDIDIKLAKQTFENLRNRTNDQGEKTFFSQSPKDILKSLALINNKEVPNIAGLLLFGKKESLKYRMPNAFVQYQQFGLSGEILENIRYDGPLIKLIPKLNELEGLKRKSDEFLYRGQSITVPEYSEKAIRETIANALSHRDYTYQNSTQVQLFNNELIVTSPGGLPRGVKIDKLLSASPSPRNRRLSEALYRLKLSEGSGRGIDFIYYGQAKYGRPTPDYSMTDNDRVSVRIPGGKANLDFCKLILSIDESLAINEMLLLNTMFINKNISLEEATKILQRSHNYAKEILLSMHRKKLVETNEKGEVFFLKASISPFARKVVTPKRISFKERERYKGLIEDVLSNREEQSKGNIADAVGLSIHQCYRLLKELEEEEKIILLKNTKKWILKKQ